MAEQEQEQKRRGLRVLAVAGVVLAVVLALVAAAPMLMPESWLGAIVAERIESALGRATTVSGARFSYFSGFHARGITVRRRAGFGDGALARIERLDVGLGLSGLLRGKVGLTHIEVHGAELALVGNEQGLLNVQDLFELPRSGWDVTVGRITVGDAVVTVRDLRRGFTEAIAFPRLAAGAAVGHKRAVRLAASVGRGGSATAEGAVWFTPDEGLFDHAELKLVLDSLAAGRLAADLAGRELPVPELADALLDGELIVGLGADREGKASGTLILRRLPPVPLLGLTGGNSSVELTVSGEISPRTQHVELSLVTRPTPAVRLTARMAPIPGREGDPAFMLDRYAIEAHLLARADLARGGLPGTALVAGKGFVTAKAKGSVTSLTASLSAAIYGGAVRTPQGTKASLPPLKTKAYLTAGGDFIQLARAILAQRPGAPAAQRAEARPAKLTLKLQADTLDVDHLAALFGRQATLKPDEVTLPECPPVADATFEATVGKVVYDGRTFERVRVAGTLSGGVIDLAEMSTQAGGGTVRGSGRLALGGDHRHALTLDVKRMPLDQEFDLLQRLPFLNIVNALVGGRPDHLSFLTTMKASFAAQGRRLDRLEATLTGKGDVVLEQVRFGASPLFRDLAVFLKRPELAGTTVFERMDVPFTVADRRIESTATTPYKGGAFVTRGTSSFAGQIDYKLYIRNPKAIDDIPGDIADYLEQGHPLVFITGTGDAPRPRIPTEAIVDFTIRNKLQRKLFDKLNRHRGREEKKEE